MNITAAYINHLRPHLSERDLRIIGTVGHFKLANAGQLERLYFPRPLTDPPPAATYSLMSKADKARIRNRQAVLRRLTKHRVLARVGERGIGGPDRGSASFLYTLDVAGQHIAETSTSRPRRPYQWYDPLIKHTLAITELYVQLVEQHRAKSLSLLDYKTEPYCWRTFPAGVLKPDAFAQVELSRGEQRRKGSFFIEVDRASQRGTKIDTKFPQYIDYWQWHKETKPDQVFPQVLFLAPHAGRVAYLKGLVRSRPEAQNLFRIELMEDAMAVLSGTR